MGMEHELRDRARRVAEIDVDVVFERFAAEEVHEVDGALVRPVRARGHFGAFAVMAAGKSGGSARSRANSRRLEKGARSSAAVVGVGTWDSTSYVTSPSCCFESMSRVSESGTTR